MPEASVAAEVEALLESCGALKRGHFVLSSGLHSDRYCQCAALFEHPARAQRVAALMASALGDRFAGATVVAPALGGVLWGYELARALDTRSLFAERVDGRFTLRRGFHLEPGERVLIAEDVVTTGGSVLELAEVLEAMGARVVGVAAVVDRSRGEFARRVADRWGFESLVTLSFETHEADALPPELARLPAEKPGSRVSTP